MATISQNGLAYLWKPECGVPRAYLVDDATNVGIVKQCSQINARIWNVILAMIFVTIMGVWFWRKRKHDMGMAVGGKRMFDSEAEKSFESSQWMLAYAAGGVVVLGLLILFLVPFFAEKRFNADVSSYSQYQGAGADKQGWIGLATQVANTNTLATSILGAGGLAGNGATAVRQLGIQR